MLETGLHSLERVNSDWAPLVKAFIMSPTGQDLKKFLKQEIKDGHTILPNVFDIFKAFEYTSFANTKVVILGQDPYHTAGVPDGLAFSTFYTNDIPPSLRNIFRELKQDMRVRQFEPIPNLAQWAREGVLLLNTSLTVRAGEAGSHAKKGWEELIKQALSMLQSDKRHKVFMLWGKHAQGLVPETTEKIEHLYLRSAHPSPLSASRGFFFNKHFTKANTFLRAVGRTEIDWLRIDHRRGRIFR